MEEELRDALMPGLLAGVLFTLAAALLGRRSGSGAAAALNAPSHVIWGDAALRERRLTVRHTVPGVVINTGAGAFWAAVMRRLFPRSASRLSVSLLAGAAVSGLAWLVDYRLIPDRLSPGIQHQVPGGALLAIHGLFALGLGVGAWLVPKARSR